jgi:hypothetical protein
MPTTVSNKLCFEIKSNLKPTDSFRIHSKDSISSEYYELAIWSSNQADGRSGIFTAMKIHVVVFRVEMCSDMVPQQRWHETKHVHLKD